MSSKSEDDGAYVKLEEGGTMRHEQQQEEEREQEQQQQLAPRDSTPWLVWPVFVFSNLSGGTAGPVMVLMQNVNPISMVGWRHQISSLAMLPGFIYESVKMDASKRRKFLSPSSLVLHLLSSLALAGHYATYSMALYRTSMPHCLFLMNTSPVYVALFVKFSGGALHPTELGGILLSLMGIGVFAVGNALESSSGSGAGSSSHVGDFLAILSAVFTAIYLVVGKSLRRWMPLFVYQFPVAVFCMIVLGAGGWISKGWAASDADAVSGPFGWLSKEYWWQTIYTGVVPGVFGHAGYSYVLRYSAPLVMPTGLTLQPIIGSCLSWLLGQTAVPGAWTWIGGAAILGGTTLVNVASALKQKKSAASSAEKPSSIDDQEQTQKPLLHNHS